MKTVKLILAFLLAITFTACSIEQDSYYDNEISLEQVLTTNNIWYVDYNRTTGSGDVAFLSKAFTISFLNGNLYANNNLVGIGVTGRGYGIPIGYYDTNRDYLEVYHDLDGYIDLEVLVVSPYEIRLVDRNSNVTYYLKGYSKNTFDFDQVFYDNIEYFLQEYVAWEKSYTSITGALNDFDNENYVAFTPNNITTFYSSQDINGTNIDLINWDYVGNYTVYDVNGYDNLKILTLDYDNTDNEEFELTVIDDRNIELYHVVSGTTYRFKGEGYIEYIRTTQETIKKERKRIKVKRPVKDRKKH